MDNHQTSIVDQFTNAQDKFEKVLARVPEEGLDWTEKEGSG